MIAGRAILLVPAAPEHAAALARDLRAGDAREIEALGLPAATIVAGSLEKSLLAWTGFHEGRLVGIVGVTAASFAAASAAPWMLTTPAAERCRIAFARASRPVLGELLGCWPLLENYVDARYRRCLLWLRWLGFSLDPPVPVGPERLPFHRFSIARR